ncbi:response regulator transcription factor [Streptomyces sp. NPDC051172]|uniref:winged helix-turn-helix transcriptional regulator n=1 Tax=Streptomyces sp. NPDC051172 TaxID=3155796 RepID=UPI003439F1E0
MNFLVVQMHNGLTCASPNAVAIASGAESVAHSEGARPLYLDVKLRSLDEVEAGRMLRSGTGVTLVAIDCRGTEQDHTGGIEADFPPYECLTATIRVLLTEIAATTGDATTTTPPTPPDDVLQSGPLRIDLSTREVSVSGKHIRLTRKEFDLLHHLASRPRQVIRREQIMADIWGNGAAHAVPSRAMRTIDTHVNSLRSKMGCRTWIETVRGVGFRFVGTAEGDPAPVALSQHNAVPLPTLSPEPRRKHSSLKERGRSSA